MKLITRLRPTTVSSWTTPDEMELALNFLAFGPVAGQILVTLPCTNIVNYESATVCRIKYRKSGSSDGRIVISPQFGHSHSISYWSSYSIRTLILHLTFVRKFIGSELYDGASIISIPQCIH